MRYMFLIFSDESTWDFSPEAMAEWGEFTESVKAKMSSGEALQGSATATTVRVREGQVATTDGPFVETKEVLGGYYVVDCNDLDEAIEVAARIPAARDGSIEIRPVVEFG